MARSTGGQGAADPTERAHLPDHVLDLHFLAFMPQKLEIVKELVCINLRDATMLGVAWPLFVPLECQ